VGDKVPNEDELKRLTNSVNEAILKEPQLEDVKKRVEDYREKVISTNKVYLELDGLVKEIKSLIQ